MRILNLGAGVQSTTVYLMTLRGEIEPIDYAIFADTQEEPKAVYEHLEWLKSLNGAPILTNTMGKLGDDLLYGAKGKQRVASIPAFTKSPVGSKGIIRRQCTSEYKINVIQETIKRHILHLKKGQRVKTQITQIFGISTDEAGRARRVADNMPKWSTPDFPLITKQMHRYHCVKWLEAFPVPHVVPRSACVFCPYHSNAEWLRIKTEDPEAWARAVEVDEILRTPGAACNRIIKDEMYLHSSCVPLKDANLINPQMAMFFKECEGMCGV